MTAYNQRDAASNIKGFVLKLSSSSDAIQTLMTNFTTAKSQNLYMGKQSQQLIPFQIIFWVVVSIYALFVGYCLFESQCIKPDQMKKYEGKKLSVPASCIILFSSIAIIAGIYEYVVKDDLQEGYANAKCSAMAYLDFIITGGSLYGYKWPGISFFPSRISAFISEFDQLVSDINALPTSGLSI